MPSMFRSSKLNADEKAARSTRARESQRLRCMVGGCRENTSQSERKLRTGVWVYGCMAGPVGSGLTRFTQDCSSVDWAWWMAGRGRRRATNVCRAKE